MNANRPTPRHITNKMAKFRDKERILKAARKKQLVTYKCAPIKLSADFSAETLQARREWQEIFQVGKSKACNQEYSTQRGCQNGRQNKEFPRQN